MGKGGPQPAHQVRPGDLQWEAASVDLEDPEANFFRHMMLPVPQLVSNETFSVEENNLEEAEADFSEPKDLDSEETIDKNDRNYESPANSRAYNSNNNAKKSLPPLEFLQPSRNQRSVARVCQEDILLKEINYFDIGREFVSVEGHMNFILRFDEFMNKTHNNKYLSSIQEEDDGSKEQNDDNNGQKERKFGKEESVLRAEERVAGGSSKKRFHRGRVPVLDVGLRRCKESDTTTGEVIIHQNVNVNPGSKSECMEHRKDMGDVIRGQALDNANHGKVPTSFKVEDNMVNSDIESLRESNFPHGPSTMDEMEHTTAPDFGSLLVTGSGWWSAEERGDSPTTLAEEGTLTSVLPLEMDHERTAEPQEDTNSFQFREADTVPKGNEDLCRKESAGIAQEQLADFLTEGERECLEQQTRQERKVTMLRNQSLNCLSEMNSSNGCHIELSSYSSFRTEMASNASPRLDVAELSLKELLQNDAQPQRCTYDPNVIWAVFGHTLNNRQVQQQGLDGSHNYKSSVLNGIIAHDFTDTPKLLTVSTVNLSSLPLEDSKENYEEVHSTSIPCQINCGISCQLDCDNSSFDQPPLLQLESTNVFPYQDCSSLKQQNNCITCEYPNLTGMEAREIEADEKLHIETKDILTEKAKVNQPYSFEDCYSKETLENHKQSTEEHHLKINEENTEQMKLNSRVYHSIAGTMPSEDYLSSPKGLELQSSNFGPLLCGENSTSPARTNVINDKALSAGDFQPDHLQYGDIIQLKEQVCFDQAVKTDCCTQSIDFSLYSSEENTNVLRFIISSPSFCYTPNEQTRSKNDIIDTKVVKELPFAQCSTLDEVISAKNETELRTINLIQSDVQNLKPTDVQSHQGGTLSELQATCMDLPKMTSRSYSDTKSCPNVTSLPDLAGSLGKQPLIKEITFSVFERHNSEFVTQRRTKSHPLDSSSRDYCNDILKTDQCKASRGFFTKRTHLLPHSGTVTTANSLTASAEQGTNLSEVQVTEHQTPRLAATSVVAEEKVASVGEDSLSKCQRRSGKLISTVSAKPKSFSVESQTSEKSARSASVQCSSTKFAAALEHKGAGNKVVPKLEAKDKSVVSSYRIVNKLGAGKKSKTLGAITTFPRAKNVAVKPHAAHISNVPIVARAKSSGNSHQNSKLSTKLPLPSGETKSNPKLSKMPAHRKSASVNCTQMTVPDKMETLKNEFSIGTTPLESALVRKITRSILLPDIVARARLKQPIPSNACVNVKTYANLNSTSNFLTPVEENLGHIASENRSSTFCQHHDTAVNPSVDTTCNTTASLAVASDPMVTDLSIGTTLSTISNPSVDANHLVIRNSSWDTTSPSAANEPENATISTTVNLSENATLSTMATSSEVTSSDHNRKFLSFLRDRFFRSNSQTRDSAVDGDTCDLSDAPAPVVCSCYRNVSLAAEDMSSSVDAPFYVTGEAPRDSSTRVIMLKHPKENSAQTRKVGIMPEDNKMSFAKDKFSPSADVNKLYCSKQYDIAVLGTDLDRSKNTLLPDIQRHKRKGRSEMLARILSDISKPRHGNCLHQQSQLSFSRQTPLDDAKSLPCFSRDTQRSVSRLYLSAAKDNHAALDHKKRKLEPLPEILKSESKRAKSVARRRKSADTECFQPMNSESYPDNNTFHSNILKDQADNKCSYAILDSNLPVEAYRCSRRNDQGSSVDFPRTTDLGAYSECSNSWKNSLDVAMPNRWEFSNKLEKNTTCTSQNNPTERNSSLVFEPSFRINNRCLSYQSQANPLSRPTTCSPDRLICNSEKYPSLRLPPIVAKDVAERNGGFAKRGRPVTYGLQTWMRNVDDIVKDKPRWTETIYDPVSEHRERFITKDTIFREPIRTFGSTHIEQPHILPVRLLADSHYHPSSNLINIVVKPIDLRINKRELNVKVNIYRTPPSPPPQSDVSKREKKTTLKRALRNMMSSQTLSRNIINQRAANPPFNTTLTAEADERYRRMFAHWKIL